MASSIDLPVCANSLDGPWAKCPNSEQFIERETDEGYMLRCRTCRGGSYWPKDKAENRGRYQAGLAVEARRQREEDEQKRVRTYSFGGS